MISMEMTGLVQFWKGEMQRTESIQGDSGIVDYEVQTSFAMLLFQMVDKRRHTVFVGDVECMEFNLR
jgi:hypothetical protein